MLPKDFNFTNIPQDKTTYKLSEVGMLSSGIEDIDAAMLSYLKVDLDLFSNTNEGFVRAPVVWVAPERAYQIKQFREMRDENGVLKLPIVSIEREGIYISKEKGAYQAHTYDNGGRGRSGRMIIAKRIVKDKTRDHAVANNRRYNPDEPYFKRENKKVVIETLSIPIPVYVDVTYKITITANFQTQINELLTPFISRTGQTINFIMRRNGHLYEGFIAEDFGTKGNGASMSEDEREFSSTISIKVLGYIIGEGANDDRPLVLREQNIVEISYPRETIVTDDGFFTI